MPELVTVTGASGHIGANLVRALVDAGRSVRAVFLEDTRAIDGLPVERVRADVRDAAAIASALAGSTVVYHLAAHISIDPGDGERVRAVNVAGVRPVVAACLQH